MPSCFSQVIGRGRISFEAFRYPPPASSVGMVFEWSISALTKPKPTFQTPDRFTAFLLLVGRGVATGDTVPETISIAQRHVFSFLKEIPLPTEKFCTSTAVQRLRKQACE